jgi:hypothetical protein
VLLESDDVTSPQWRETLREWRHSDTRGLYLKVYDKRDEQSVRMRSIAIWEAQETMERGAIERDDHSTFLA